GAAANRETRLRRAAGGDRYGLRVRPVNRAVPRDAAELHRVTPGRQTGKRHASGDPNGPTRATVYGDRVTVRVDVRPRCRRAHGEIARPRARRRPPPGAAVAA